MKFWETFITLCNREGKSPNRVARELGIPSGSVTWWKKGKVPHKTTLETIANYFNVSMDYLLGYELNEKEKNLIKLFNCVPNDKQDYILQLIEVALKGIE